MSANFTKKADLPDATLKVMRRLMMSDSGVIGIPLSWDANGHNRFGIVVEDEEGNRVGEVFRVQPDFENLSLLFRDSKGEADPDELIAHGAPIYSREALGRNFWLERF